MDGCLLIGGFVGAVLVSIALIKWDNHQMERQAERKARSVRAGVGTKPFPDFDEWKKWDRWG